MTFIYDKIKNELNFRKHGIWLSEAQLLWDNHHIILPAKLVQGEYRWMIIGCLKNKTYVAIYTIINGNTRIISCHRADKRYERLYHDHF